MVITWLGYQEVRLHSLMWTHWSQTHKMVWCEKGEMGWLVQQFRTIPWTFGKWESSPWLNDAKWQEVEAAIPGHLLRVTQHPKKLWITTTKQVEMMVIDTHKSHLSGYPLVNWHSHGKSSSLIGKSTINGPFSIANCERLPEGIPD